jgi:hypothetical protein
LQSLIAVMAELAQKAALRLTKAASPVGPGNVPTLGEFVAGYEAGAMNGIGVPRNTPLQIIGRLNVALFSGTRGRGRLLPDSGGGHD